MSDYFSYWRLKALLSKGQHNLQNLEESLMMNEQSLDYSYWRG